LFRWEKAGLVKLFRIGGKTIVTDETVEAILSGKIKLPQHSARITPLRPKSRPRGRPRKPKPESE
jgi:hypothetical protein